MKKIKRQLRIVKILMIIAFLFVIGNTVILIGKGVAAAGVNYVTQSESIQAPDATNFLLIGSDLGGNRTYENDGVRTDVLMVINFIPENERENAEINVMSVPRDVYVQYACGGEGKINAAAKAGADAAALSGGDSMQAGIDCTVGSVENLFDIVIDYYVMFDFDSFISIVDGIGGIDLNNQYQFCEQDENGVEDAYCFDEGEIHLDGGAALAYARQRYSSSDYERGQRQQLIMSKILFKLINNPTKYIDTFAKALIADTENNLSIDLLLSLLNWAAQTYNNTLEQISSGEPFYIDVKGTPFSNDTGFNMTSTFDDSLALANTGTYPITELYDDYDLIEDRNTITRYMFTKNNLSLPSRISDENTDQQNIIELQFISTYVSEIYSPTGFYSAVDEYTAAYVSNQFTTYDSTSNLFDDDQFSDQF